VNPGRRTTVAEVVTASIVGGLDHLLDAEAELQAPHDPETVHRARVATRRLRSDLRTFGAFLDERCALALRDELGWLGEELGLVRDLDVLEQGVRMSLVALPDPDASSGPKLIERLRVQREAASAELASALREQRHGQLIAQLTEAAEAPPLTGAAAETPVGEAAPSIMRRPWRAATRAAEAAGPEPTDPELHAVRIRAKRVRYAAEALAPACGRRMERVAKAATQVQRELGEHQDAVVASAWLRDQAAGSTPSVAFAAGELAASMAERRERARQGWPSAWKDLRTAWRKAWA
jgi:CHAD domain-containing protein